MQFISRVFRLALVFSGFLFLGWVLTVVVLGSAPPGIQSMVVLVFAALATKWYRRRVQRRSALGGQSKKKRSNAGSKHSRTNNESLQQALNELAAGKPFDLFVHKPNLRFEKFHQFLSSELLKKDALSCRLDVDSLSSLCGRL